jgi:hypothetical protein
MLKVATLIWLGAFGCAAQRAAQGTPTSNVANAPPEDQSRVDGRPPESPSKRPLQPEDVSAVVHRGTPTLRACYEHHVKWSRVEDRIKVSWVIDAAGKPSNIRIEDTTFPDHEVETCVTSAIMSWSFAASDGSVEVAFPFIFRFE